MNTFVLSFQELTVRTGNCQSYANLAGASSSGDQYYHVQTLTETREGADAFEDSAAYLTFPR